MTVNDVVQKPDRVVFDKPVMMAFWKYDTFPFVLCGSVVVMKDSGMVETVEFGRGYWFRPFKLLPLAAGMELKDKLEKLTDEYNGRIKEIKEMYNNIAKALVGE